MEHETVHDPTRQSERLNSYATLLRTENERLGLVSPLMLPQLESRLLAPCVALAQLPIFAGENLRVVDLGSGGGLPGIPLALERPHVQLLLVDSMLRKCRFLETVKEALGLDNVEVLHARVEKVRDRPAPDIFLARFVKDLRLLAAWTRRWRQPGTRYLIFAGEDDAPQPVVYDLQWQKSHALGAGKVAHEYLATS